MRVRLRGINRSVKRLADGTTITYWYAWRGGPRLRGEPGTPEFVASYNAAVATKVAPAPGTLGSVLTAYQGSSKFTSLRESTRRDYARCITRIEKRFATFPLGALTDPRTRGLFMDWRDELGKRSPRQADLAWAVLNVAVSWGLDRGLVPCNPFTKGGSLYHGSRADQIWSLEQEERFLTSAPCLRLPFLLAVWTGQRQGDLLRLPWSAYDGRVINLKQSKGGKRVVIPVGGPLKAALDAAPNISTLILTNNGRAWTGSAFRHMWLRACKAAGIKGVTFHDLRGTAVTRLAIAGCTVPEIVAITGHSLADASTILGAHYLHLDQQALRERHPQARNENEFANRATNRAAHSRVQP
jgi:integrase